MTSEIIIPFSALDVYRFVKVWNLYMLKKFYSTRTFYARCAVFKEIYNIVF
jgi:hypothetical protein